MRLSRLSIYGLLSTTSAILVILRAIILRNAQFYSICIHLTSSPLCLMIMCNLGLFLTITFGKGAQRLFFGNLRPLEIEHLYERSRYAITDTCLAMTIFRDDFDVKFISFFVILLLVKIFHWLAQDRVDFMEQTPNVPLLFHLRMSSINILLTLIDACLTAYAVDYTLRKGPSMMIIFGFEYMILMTLMTSTTAKYLLHTIDLRQEAPWEDKSMYIFYLELAIDFFKLLIYCLFLAVVVHFYGLPIHIIRDLYLTLRSFVQKVRDLVQYRRATLNMEARYPNATTAELTNSDRTCIICREEMAVQQPPPANNQQQAQARLVVAGVAVNIGGPVRAAHPDTPKKLPCGHIFHFRCLRSWMERQQACPTCRRSVLETNPTPPVPQPQVTPIVQPGHQPNIPQPPPGPIHAPFRPWTPSAWAGPSTQAMPNTAVQPSTASSSTSALNNPSDPITNSPSSNISDYSTTVHTTTGVFPVTLTPLVPMNVGVKDSSHQPVVLDHLSDEQLIQLEGIHREAILARIQAIQLVQQQLNGIVSQFSQLLDLMGSPRAVTSGNDNNVPGSTGVADNSLSSSGGLSSSNVDRTESKDKGPVRS